jgi:capsular polysaccharide biosynthesis protein
VKPVARVVRALRPAAIDRQAKALASLEASTEALQQDVTAMRALLGDVSARLAALHTDTEALLAICRDEAQEQARMGAPSGARLAADGIRLIGPPSARLRARRLRSGEAVDLPFGSHMGLTVVASTASDVRELWQRVLAREAACVDDRLRGAPSTALEIHHATVARAGEHTIDVTLDATGAPDRVTDAITIAVPKLTYHFSARKLRNVGHWLLDGVPQIVALDALAPDAVFLLPDPLKGIYTSTLELLGIAAGRLRPWTGGPVSCSRLLLLEDDARAGGGRPLSALLQTRRRLLERAAVPDARPWRRIYVSRRDAKPHRRWVDNEPDVEALFASRGFEILSMRECPLAEQVRLFASARVVAGASGAGLADLVFAPPGTHVITLVSDELLRWYAAEGQSRALWLSPSAAAGGELAQLGDSPRFYAHVAAAFGQVSHCFVGPDQVPLGALSAFLDDVLARVDAA